MSRAGDYRHVVRLQKEVFIADGQGGFTKDWADIDTVPAQVITGGGAEMLHAGALEYTISYRVKFRWRSDVTPAQRLIWVDGTNNRILDVSGSVNPDGFHRDLELSCTERIPVPGPLI